MRVLRYLSVSAFIALSLLRPSVAKADDHTVYVTYYVETNGQGWPYPGVIACDYSIPRGTIIRIMGLEQGSWDHFTQHKDLFQCQDHYATSLSFRFDVWKVDDDNNITGYYPYQILGRLDV